MGVRINLITKHVPYSITRRKILRHLHYHVLQTTFVTVAFVWNTRSLLDVKKVAGAVVWVTTTNYSAYSRVARMKTLFRALIWRVRTTVTGMVFVTSQRRCLRSIKTIYWHRSSWGRVRVTTRTWLGSATSA